MNFKRLKLFSGLVLLLSGCDGLEPNSDTQGTTSRHTIANNCFIEQSQIGSYVELPGGDSIMGKDPRYIEEGQATQVSIEGFKMLAHEVTNQQFQEFVDETQYITLAEREDNGGSALFTQADNKKNNEQASSLNPISPWTLATRVSWRTPEGPDSNISDRLQHPVVHISLADAIAYADWAGGRLPTEQEWEYAASIGLHDPLDQTSGAYDKQGNPVANVWQGVFPLINSAKDGYLGTAPIGCYPPSKVGLYDMIGNVWEWTSSEYRGRSNTIKGGSYLCAENFCGRYRPAARQPHERDFSSNHIGFRVVKEL